MRLGLWNRLALVVAATALVVAPVWTWLSIARNASETTNLWRDFCTSQADKLLISPDAGERLRYPDVTKACWDDWSRSSAAMAPGWREYGYALLATAVACALIYGITWLTVWTVKWVWRGRSVDSGNRASP